MSHCRQLECDIRFAGGNESGEYFTVLKLVKQVEVRVESRSDDVMKLGLELQMMKVKERDFSGYTRYGTVRKGFLLYAW